MVCVSVFQDREVRPENVGVKIVGGRCFSDKGSRFHGGFKVILYEKM